MMALFISGVAVAEDAYVEYVRSVCAQNHAVEQ